MRPLKVVIEITKGSFYFFTWTEKQIFVCSKLIIKFSSFFFSLDGHINVLTDNKAEPLLSAYDPNPLPVKYISFASFEYANVEYLYNCVSDKTALVSAVPKKPAHQVDPNDLQTVPVEGISLCSLIYIKKKRRREVIAIYKFWLYTFNFIFGCFT